MLRQQKNARISHGRLLIQYENMAWWFSLSHCKAFISTHFASLIKKFTFFARNIGTQFSNRETFGLIQKCQGLFALFSVSKPVWHLPSFSVSWLGNTPMAKLRSGMINFPLQILEFFSFLLGTPDWTINKNGEMFPFTLNKSVLFWCTVLPDGKKQQCLLSFQAGNYVPRLWELVDH